MKIEDEIHQTQFRNQKQKLAINITFTHYWLMDRFRQLLKQYDISSQQFNILRILRGQYPQPSSVNLLKERMLDKSSDASRLIDRLKIKGLVQRKQCKSDRRAVDILITEKGLEILKKIDAHNTELDSVFDKLSEKETEKLNELLDKLRTV